MQKQNRKLDTIFYRGSKRFYFDILISALFIFIIKQMLDWKDVLKLIPTNFSFEQIILFIFLGFLIVCVYAFRWMLLFSSQIILKHSFIVTMVGLGCNMLLPLRGGDLVRLQYTKKLTGVTTSQLIAIFFVEKIIDLLSVFLIGIASIISLYGNYHVDSYYIGISVSLIGFIIIFWGGVFIHEQTILSILTFLLRKILKVSPTQEVLLILKEIRNRMHLKVIFLPLIVTVFMWVIVYTMSYILLANICGIQLTYADSLLIVFAGAIGLMIPAAPSGVGSFHASVISSFIVLGKSISDGFVFASIVHLGFFFLFVIPAIACLFFLRLHRKEKNI